MRGIEWVREGDGWHLLVGRKDGELEIKLINCRINLNVVRGLVGRENGKSDDAEHKGERP